jgi:hypothetical protein
MIAEKWNPVFGNGHVQTIVGASMIQNKWKER